MFTRLRLLQAAFVTGLTASTLTLAVPTETNAQFRPQQPGVPTPPPLRTGPNAMPGPIPQFHNFVGGWGSQNGNINANGGAPGQFGVSGQAGQVGQFGQFGQIGAIGAIGVGGGKLFGANGGTGL